MVAVLPEDGMVSCIVHISGQNYVFIYGYAMPPNSSTEWQFMHQTFPQCGSYLSPVFKKGTRIRWNYVQSPGKVGNGYPSINTSFIPVKQ